MEYHNQTELRLAARPSKGCHNIHFLTQLSKAAYLNL